MELTQEQIDKALALLDTRLKDGTIDTTNEEQYGIEIGKILDETLQMELGPDFDIDLNDALAEKVWEAFDAYVAGQ